MAPDPVEPIRLYFSLFHGTGICSQEGGSRVLKAVPLGVISATWEASSPRGLAVVDRGLGEALSRSSPSSLAC